MKSRVKKIICVLLIILTIFNFMNSCYADEVAHDEWTDVENGLDFVGLALDGIVRLAVISIKGFSNNNSRCWRFHIKYSSQVSRSYGVGSGLLDWTMGNNNCKIKYS